LEHCLNKDKILSDISLECPICLNLVIFPLECEKCETMACEPCLKNWNNSCVFKCGANYKPIHKVYRILLSKLEFSCPNECPVEVIKYDDLKDHLLNNCMERIIKC
jgi:hypothetical protein